MIEPWLTVYLADAASAFYTSAFGAEETSRMEHPGGGTVIRMSIKDANFWVSSEGESKTIKDAPVKSENIRLIIIDEHPEIIFANALKAGATSVFPVEEGHGWRIGRLTDPFGIDWEIGYEV